MSFHTVLVHFIIEFYVNIEARLNNKVSTYFERLAFEALNYTALKKLARAIRMSRQPGASEKRVREGGAGA